MLFGFRCSLRLWVGRRLLLCAAMPLFGNMCRRLRYACFRLLPAGSMAFVFWCVVRWCACVCLFFSFPVLAFFLLFFRWCGSLPCVAASFFCFVCFFLLAFVCFFCYLCLVVVVLLVACLLGCAVFLLSFFRWCLCSLPLLLARLLWSLRLVALARRLLLSVALPARFRVGCVRCRSPACSLVLRPRLLRAAGCSWVALRLCVVVLVVLWLCLFPALLCPRLVVVCVPLVRLFRSRLSLSFRLARRVGFPARCGLAVWVVSSGRCFLASCFRRVPCGRGGLRGLLWFALGFPCLVCRCRLCVRSCAAFCACFCWLCLWG